MGFAEGKLEGEALRVQHLPPQAARVGKEPRRSS